MASERALKDMVKGGGILVIGLFIGNGLEFILKTYIARSLGPELFGKFSIGLNFLLMAGTFSLLGFWTTLPRLTAVNEHDPERRRGDTYFCFCLSFALSLTAAAFLIFFSDQIAVYLLKDASSASIVTAFACGIPCMAMFRLGSALLRGLKAIKHFVYSRDIINKTVTFAGVGAAFALGQGVAGVAAAYGIGFFISFVFILYFTRLGAPELFAFRSSSTTEKMKIVRFSMPIFVSVGVKQVCQRIDIFILGYFYQTTQSGLYSAAYQLAYVLNLLPICMDIIILPIVAPLAASGRFDEIRALYKTLTRWLCCISYPIFLIMVLRAPLLLTSLFGPEYLSAAWALRIMSTSFFIVALISSWSQIIIGLGRSTPILYCAIFSAVLRLTATALLVPVFGLDGAAAASAVYWATEAVFGMFLLYKYLNVTFFSLKTAKYLATTSLVFSIFFAFESIIPQSPIVLMFYWASFLILSIFVGTAFVGLTDEDDVILKAVETKTGISLNFIRKIGRHY